MNKLDFVINQINCYSGTKKYINAYSCFVLCPFHGERTPSCRIHYAPTSRSPGFWSCYGCGAKGNWDTIAPKLGLKQYQWAKPEPEFARTLTTKVLVETDTNDKDLVLEPLPPNKIWRTIKTNLLIELGSKLLYQSGKYQLLE